MTSITFPDQLPGSLLAELQAFSVLELISVVLAIAYLLLAIRQNIWCWYCAAISTACYVWIFIDARLYMESALHVFYLAMAVYGWYSWRHGARDRESLPVVVWTLGTHGKAVLGIIVLSSISGFLLQRYSDAVFPYIDSLTTWSAVWATFLVARKVLENWWYWLLIDAASMVIYWTRDLHLTSVLFAMYLVLIPFGLWSWVRSYRKSVAV
ncbi:nicotinamide riboside transporter PnuC [Woeseia oceani]|uniref:nicotinamide riboside transporter PnuC n=1 Tax=Woeseia oceani TaxID=1548547 RepID=UPI0018D2A0A9|nr:nicotinamide riboside transporter PnuC [Woeseia oceani]